MSQPAVDAARPACRDHTALFQDPLLEEPPTRTAPLAVRREQAVLTGRAAAVCAACPLRVECLTTAVLRHEVAGFVAGTTARERTRIRVILDWKLPAENLDSLAGVTGRNRQIDHDEVVRLRRTHPDESLERIAKRLGCSLSTVKRQLRAERHAPAVRSAPTPEPTVEEVLAATARVAEVSFGHAQQAPAQQAAAAA